MTTTNVQMLLDIWHCKAMECRRQAAELITTAQAIESAQSDLDSAIYKDTKNEGKKEMDNLDVIISLRYINMDDRRYTTDVRLIEYAQNFPGGMHRAVTRFEVAPWFVVTGYGIKPFDYEDLLAVDAKLQNMIHDAVHKDSRPDTPKV